MLPEKHGTIIFTDAETVSAFQLEKIIEFHTNLVIIYGKAIF